MQLNIKAIINVYACYIVVMVGIGLIRILPSPDQKLVNLDVGETFPVVVPYRWEPAMYHPCILVSAWCLCGGISHLAHLLSHCTPHYLAVDKLWWILLNIAPLCCVCMCRNEEAPSSTLRHHSHAFQPHCCCCCWCRLCMSIPQYFIGRTTLLTWVHLSISLDVDPYWHEYTSVFHSMYRLTDMSTPQYFSGR